MLLKTTLNGFQPWTNESSWTPLFNLDKDNSYKVLRILKIIFWTNYHSFFQIIMGEINGRHLHFCQLKHRHTVGCILHVLHVSDPWLFFICIYEVLFERSYIFWRRISAIFVYYAVPDQNTWRCKAPPSMTTWVSKEIILFHNWSFSLFPYLHPSNFSFLLDGVIGLFSEHLLTLNF